MSNNKIIGIIIVVIFIIGSIVIVSKKSDQDSVQVSSRPHDIMSPVITLVEVNTHKDASSCWSAVNGKVYDLTNWIGKHPGGQKAILFICGKDGSVAFNNQHDTQEKPAKALASFYIGELK